MFRHKLYLDTCILIAYYYKDDKKHNEIVDFLEKISKIKNLDLVLSAFCLTEFTKVYIDIQDIKKTDGWKITSNLTFLELIGKKYPFKFVNTEGKERGYKFETFFVDIREIIMNYTKKPRIHLADAIHCAIMINNNIKYIVTTNKKDFEGIKGVIALEPTEALKKFLKK